MTEDRRIVHILGAGVDKSLGMPLANELMSEVAKFANGAGKPIATALRSKFPYLRFSFDRYTGEQGESVAERILMKDPQFLDTFQEYLADSLEEHDKEADGHTQAVRTVIDNLVEDSSQKLSWMIRH